MRERGIRLKLGFLASRCCSCDRRNIAATSQVKLCLRACTEESAQYRVESFFLCVICNHRERAHLSSAAAFEKRPETLGVATAGVAAFGGRGMPPLGGR
jgi:hypothetical protein